MKQQVMPEVRVWFYPESAIPQRQHIGASIAERMTQHARHSYGDTLGKTLAGTSDFLTPATDDGAVGFLGGANVEFVRFERDGNFREGYSVSRASVIDNTDELAGFIVKADETVLDTYIGSQEVIANWERFPMKGDGGHWVNVSPPSSPFHLCVMNVDDVSAPLLSEPLEADQSFRAHINCIGIFDTKAAAAPPEVLFGWGNDALRVALRHGAPPTLERKGGQGASDTWRVWKRIGDRAINLNNNQHNITVRKIAGRLVVGVNGTTIHLLEVIKVGNQLEVADTPSPAGALSVLPKNVRVVFSFYKLKYKTAAPGTFAVRVAQNASYSLDDLATPPKGITGGWDGGGTSTAVVSEFDAQRNIKYTVTLQPDVYDLYTPFVNKVLIPMRAAWSTPAEADFLEARPYLKSVSVDMAMPPNAPGAECRIELDRALLDKQLIGWENYIGKYHPVGVMIRRKWDDGTSEAWTRVFKGYVIKMDKGTNMVNDATLTLLCRDPIVRLQKPAAVVDARDAPLDFLYTAKTQNTDNRASLQLYGSECVAEIIARRLGAGEAARLNGGGNTLVVRQGAFIPDRYVRFFPASHYPLMDASNDAAGYVSVMAGITGKPPTSDGFLFPPPFGEDALSWISQFAGYDRAAFFYGWPGNSERFEEWPMPCYGRMNNFAATGVLRTVYDTDYVGGDLDRLLLSATTETRPEKDINRVLVWGNPPGATVPALLPALMMGEARLSTNGDTYHNAAEYSWERTEVLKEDIAGYPGVAQGIAQGYIGQLQGVKMQFPDVTLRLHPQWFWGDQIQFEMSSAASDASLGLQGHTFRVEAVTHQVNFAGGDPMGATTQLKIRPLSATGL